MTKSAEILEEQLRIMRKLNQDLIRIMNSKRIVTKDVEKEIVFHNENVVVELTKLQDKGESEVHNTPFDSDIVIVDGQINLNHNGTDYKLTRKNRSKNLPKGSTAFGKAVGETAVITIIDTK